MDPALTPIVTGLVGLVTGLITGIVIEPIKALMWGPRIHLGFVDDDPAYVADGYGPTNVPVRVVRISAIAKRAHLKECQAFVVGVERGDGVRWEATPLIDPLRLPWAATTDDQHRWTRDLPTGVRFFVDVCASTLVHYQKPEGGRDQLNLASDVIPNHLTKLLADTGHYRIDIFVTGNAAKPRRQRVTIAWAGKWDSLKARPS